MLINTTKRRVPKGKARGSPIVDRDGRQVFYKPVKKLRVSGTPRLSSSKNAYTSTKQRTDPTAVSSVVVRKRQSYHVITSSSDSQRNNNKATAELRNVPTILYPTSQSCSKKNDENDVGNPSALSSRRPTVRFLVSPSPQSDTDPCGGYVQADSGDVVDKDATTTGRQDSSKLGNVVQ